MALASAHGAIQWQSADAATTVYTVSGLSFAPTAIRVYGMGLGSASDTSSTTTHLRAFFGFAVGTSDRRCVGVQDQDAAASMTLTTGYRTDCIAMTLTSTPAMDGALDINSFTSDGFTLIVDDAAPVNITVFWEAWGGTSVAVIGEIAEPAATGNVDYTVTGFDAGGSGDQVVMFAGVQATAAAPTAARNDSGLCVGAASSGSAANNICISVNNDDGSASSDCDVYTLDGECIAMMTVAGGNPSARATLTQFGTDNFRLNWIARATTGRKYIFLALKGGKWAAGSTTINTASGGATATVSGLSFAPQGMSLMTSENAEDAAGTSTARWLLFLGSGSSTTSRRAMSADIPDGAGNSDVRLYIEYDQILTGGTSMYDINAMNSDGFQLIIDTADAAEGVSWVGYLTWGEPAVVGPTPTSRFLYQAVPRAAYW